MSRTFIVIGGGAAGFFGAIACARQNPSGSVFLLEQSNQVLSKVRISGGGRCNVTHACFDPHRLVTFYPRGQKELIGPFHRFQPKDTVEWFESRGVRLKTEGDGRMFPETDSSTTIIDCLEREAASAGVKVILSSGVKKIEKEGEKFLIYTAHPEPLLCESVLVATGSSAKVLQLIQELGHAIVPPVPSLFTFNIPESPFGELAGVAVSAAEVSLPAIGKKETGPLLITHWGISGPSVLKLSAWSARELHALQYATQIAINWVPEKTKEQLAAKLAEAKQLFPARLIGSEPLLPIPKQLWKVLVHLAIGQVDKRWSYASSADLQALTRQFSHTSLQMQGKTTYKQEFVTAGGILLEEVNFKTMESKICPQLFFAGEILNIDGITGGFNFQNAWTTSWIAGSSMGSKCGKDKM